MEIITSTTAPLYLSAGRARGSMLDILLIVAVAIIYACDVATYADVWKKIRNVEC